MGAIVGEVIGGVIGLIIAAVKSTVFYGADALFCGGGNALGNVITGLMGAGGLASWVNIGAYGAYVIGALGGAVGALGTGLGALGTGLGGIGAAVGGVGLIPALIGAVSGLIGGIGGTILNLLWNAWTTIEPIITSAIAALIGLIPII